MSKITTHVLDVSVGRPAAGVEIVLFFGEREVARARTNADGRIGDWGGTGNGGGSAADGLATGVYRLRFETGEYFRGQAVATFYPFVEIYFELGEGHYHVPLLLSPWGYSTYRGS